MSDYKTITLSKTRFLVFLFLITILLGLISCSNDTITEPVPDMVEEKEDVDEEDNNQEPEENVWSVNREGQNALNLIFLKPSDYELSNETIDNVSTMLLYVQKWYEKQMELNGYGKKTFGLITNQYGKVRVHIINDSQTASYYKDKETQNPYSTLEELNNKVANLLASNPDFKTSSHSLILSTEETLIRFVGSGRNAYARSTDFSLTPTGKFIDDLELMNSDRLGGILHELGHGLNVPHNCHKSSDFPKVALMSFGNQTYENNQEEKVFLTPATAAILNVNETFNLSDNGIVYYSSNSIELLELSVTKNETEKIVHAEGKLSSDAEITAVYLGNDGGSSAGSNTNYDDITFITELNPLGNAEYNFRIEIPFSELFNGYKDDEKNNMLFSINAINSNGNRKKVHTYNYTIDLATQIPNDDIAQDFRAFEFGDRSIWSVSANSTSPNTARGVENVLDGDTSSYWHSNYPYFIAEDGGHVIDLDMQSENEFSGIYLQSNRNGSNFRPSHLSVWISNDGQNYTEVQQFDVSNSTEVQLLFDDVQISRYLRIQVDSIHVATGEEENLIINEIDILTN